MKLPIQMHVLKQRVSQDIAAYFQHYQADETRLLLDSTGPGFTRQYIVLNAIGYERLRECKEIHAFSGSVFALFGFIAFSTGANRLSVDELCDPRTEKIFRDQHHSGSFSGIKSLARLATGGSAFSSTQALIDSLETTFGDFVNQPFSYFDANIHIYLAKTKGQPPLILSNNARCSPELQMLRQHPIKHIIAMAANVPFVYGGIQSNTPYFDPVYGGHYLPTLKSLTSDEQPTLISTPWRSGRKAHRHFVNCYPRGNPYWLMSKDFARLVAGFNNVTWSRDIFTAFKLE